MTLYLLTTLSPRMLSPAHASVDIIQLTPQEAFDMITPDTRVGATTPGMRALYAQLFPGLDVHTTCSNIQLNAGDKAVILSYLGPKIDASGVPAGNYSLHYAIAEVFELEQAAA